jgi:hypothetical protein
MTTHNKKLIIHHNYGMMLKLLSSNYCRHAIHHRQPHHASSYHRGFSSLFFQSLDSLADCRNQNKFEEKAIAQAIRTIKDKQFKVVVEVMNACHVDWADRNLPARHILQRNANIWIRVLTHSDLLSKEALKYQIKRASYISSISEKIRWNKKSNYQIPVVALDLEDLQTSSSKSTKKFRTVMEMLLGGLRRMANINRY